MANSPSQPSAPKRSFHLLFWCIGGLLAFHAGNDLIERIVFRTKPHLETAVGYICWTLGDLIGIAFLAWLAISILRRISSRISRWPSFQPESGSLWRKPWRGLRGFALWFALIASATFVVVLGGEVLGGMMKADNALAAALASSAGLGVAGAGGIALIHWLRSWRNLRRFLIGAACVVTLFGLFFAVENWRGRNAWQTYKHTQEAKGEKLDMLAVAPPPVPDDQNFATTPLVASSYAMCMDRNGRREGRDEHAVNRMAISIYLSPNQPGIDVKSDFRSWQKSQKLSLESMQEYYRKLSEVTNWFAVPPQPRSPAADVALALSRYDSTIEELRRDSQLPFSRFPLDYGNENPASILLPHLAGMKAVNLTLQYRALSELELGQTEKALEDLQLMFRLTESVRHEPTLISDLVRMAIVQFIGQVIWEGLADHRWSDAQLVALDRELGKLDFLADHHFAMRGERAMDVGCIEFMRRTRDLNQLLSGMGDSSPDGKLEDIVRQVAFRGAPGGWFEQNKLSICRTYEEYFFPQVDQQAHTVSPAARNRAESAIEATCTQMEPHPYTFFTRILLPALGRTAEKSARAHVSVDLARGAIALERYRLAQGQYPQSLEEVAPRFLDKLPSDVIGGQPLKYRRSDDGRFILYSVGWNEKDDGGTVVCRKKDCNDSGVDFQQGDWVWKYPAKN